MTKNLIFVTGNKGGTGKSTFARALLDRYLARGMEVTSFDADKETPSLSRFYSNIAPVQQLDMSKKNALDGLIECLYKDVPNIALVDLPASSARAFQDATSELDFFGWIKEETEYRVSIASVLSNQKVSVVTLKEMLDFFDKKNIDYIQFIAVKNLFFGEDRDFAEYNNSKTRKHFADWGGREIAMPCLFEEAYKAIDSKSMPFMDAATDSEINLANRRRIHTWLGKVQEQLDTVADLIYPDTVDLANAA